MQGGSGVQPSWRQRQVFLLLQNCREDFTSICTQSSCRVSSAETPVLYQVLRPLLAPLLEWELLCLARNLRQVPIELHFRSNGISAASKFEKTTGSSANSAKLFWKEPRIGVLWFCNRNVLDSEGAAWKHMEAFTTTSPDT